jgi:hypothetical protein
MTRSISARTGCCVISALLSAALACSEGTGLVNSNGAGGTSSTGGSSSNAAGAGGTSSVGGTTGAGGTQAMGGAMATTSSCSFLPADPSIATQITCSSFIPALAPYQIVFVEQTTSGPPGNQVVAHRFRATAACGFDVVISLPNLKFAADDQPYQMSVWWLQSAGKVSLLAIAIRRSLSGPVLLGVAAPESADLLNFLVSPLAVTLNGPACTDPAQAGNTSQILEDNDAALSCDDEADVYALRLCHDGNSAYRMVAYHGLPDSADLPAVFGASDSLVPLE